MINKQSFYKLLNEGLFQKYCRSAGPVQDTNITYRKKSDIKVLQKRKVGNAIEIDFVGDFLEEKTINADLSNPTYIEIRLNNVEGTLFVEDDRFDDLILELR